jgi:hypothetical protein
MCFLLECVVINIGPRLFGPTNGENEVFGMGLGERVDRVIDKVCRGSEVPLRAFWCEAGVPVIGRWRQATEREERKIYRR